MDLFGIDQPDVTLTDYGLALVCAAIIWRLRTGRPFYGPTRFWLTVFFGGVGLGALLGGTYHGFLEASAGPAAVWMWVATLIAIGLAALGAWGTGARLVLRGGAGDSVVGLAAALFLVYSVMIFGGSRSFAIAVAHYLPAAIFLLVCVAVAYRRSPDRGFAVAALGLLLTFAAALVQQQRWALQPIHFDHNATYHVVQAVALILFYRGIAGALRG